MGLPAEHLDVSHGLRQTLQMGGVPGGTHLGVSGARNAALFNADQVDRRTRPPFKTIVEDAVKLHRRISSFFFRALHLLNVGNLVLCNYLQKQCIDIITAS